MRAEDSKGALGALGCLPPTASAERLHLPFQPQCPSYFLPASDIYSLIVAVVLAGHLKPLHDRGEEGNLESSTFLWKGPDEMQSVGGFPVCPA